MWMNSTRTKRPTVAGSTTARAATGGMSASSRLVASCIPLRAGACASSAVNLAKDFALTIAIRRSECGDGCAIGATFTAIGWGLLSSCCGHLSTSRIRRGLLPPQSRPDADCALPGPSWAIDFKLAQQSKGLLQTARSIQPGFGHGQLPVGECFHVPGNLCEAPGFIGATG